jgi:hypothetical protein
VILLPTAERFSALLNFMTFPGCPENPLMRKLAAAPKSLAPTISNARQRHPIKQWSRCRTVGK